MIERPELAPKTTKDMFASVSGREFSSYEAWEIEMLKIFNANLQCFPPDYEYFQLMVYFEERGWFRYGTGRTVSFDIKRKEDELKDSWEKIDRENGDPIGTYQIRLAERLKVGLPPQITKIEKAAKLAEERVRTRLETGEESSFTVSQIDELFFERLGKARKEEVFTPRYPFED